MYSNMSCPAPSTGPVNQMFTMLMQGLLVSQCSISDPSMWPNDYGLTAMKNGLPEYDFIVVGAGSAGAVVANRLSENPYWRVLLLEAGGDPPLESVIPSGYSALQNTAYDWIYHAEISDKHSKIYVNGSFWPRGKLLGGSSAINGMVYIRGFPEDYNEWGEMGNEGWDYETALYYFKKAENNQDPELRKDRKYHSTIGPMMIDHYKSNSTILEAVRKAVFEMGMGFKEAQDFNGEDRNGFGLAQGTLANGRRQSTAEAYLAPIRTRRNLHVIKNAHVTDLDIYGDEVTAVNFRYNSATNFKAVVRNEVILSAGAVNTPQILMLSGIGPKKDLKELGIRVKHDLNVGKNMQDHVYVTFFVSLNNVADPLTTEDSFNQYYQYLLNRTGAVATRIVEFQGFINVNSNETVHPDIQINHNPAPPQSGETLRRSLTVTGYPERVVSQIVEKNKKSTILSVFLILCNPKSTGQIKLQDKNPFSKPRIIPNYLDHEEDLKTLTKTIQMYSKIVETDTFKEAEAEVLKFEIPECDIHDYGTYNYWECYVKYFSTTLYHPVSTAKMGPDDDEFSVVDPSLKVRGMYNLRVIDASIMPKIVSTNTNAASIMIGERGSDLVKDEWEY